MKEIENSLYLIQFFVGGLMGGAALIAATYTFLKILFAESDDVKNDLVWFLFYMFITTVIVLAV